MSVPYAVCCKSCGHIERFAWEKVVTPMSPDGEFLRSTTPLTPKGRIPVSCPHCGATREGAGTVWREPATAEDLARFDAMQARAARARELCGSLNTDGMFKIPDDARVAPEIRNAISNLLAPLEGEALKLAQVLVLKVARSGAVLQMEQWVELYDKAVAKALKDAKETKGVKATA